MIMIGTLAPHTVAPTQYSGGGTLFSHTVYGAYGASMEFVVPGCKPEPSPRLHAAKIHLTYAALYPDELDFTALVTAARGWGDTKAGLRE